MGKYWDRLKEEFNEHVVEPVKDVLGMDPDEKDKPNVEDTPDVENKPDTEKKPNAPEVEEKPETEEMPEMEEPEIPEPPEVPKEVAEPPVKETVVSTPTSSINVDSLINSALSKVNNFCSYVCGNILGLGSSSTPKSATENTFSVESPSSSTSTTGNMFNSISPFNFSGTTQSAYSSISPLVESLLSGKSQTSYKTPLIGSSYFSINPNFSIYSPFG